MWLWRGETGLWERDPATPLNFRENLIGIAFDPNNPARGYAVGTSAVGHHGVLLRYGKSWTEETTLPAQVQNASFTAIAFAGSEAIVAYREQPEASSNTFVGGLLVNEGSGWRVESEAASAIGKGYPAGLAALPDGGAAMVVEGGEGKHVFEREGAGAPWQQTPTPLPGHAGRLARAVPRRGGAARDRHGGGHRPRRPQRSRARSWVPAPRSCPGLAAGAGKRRRAAPDSHRVERRGPRIEPGPRAGSELRVSGPAL